MKKFNTLFELLKFPIKLLLIGYILFGIGTLLLGDNFSIFYNIENQIIVVILEIFIKIGSFIILNFPLLIIIKAVSRKTNSYVPILSSILGYALFLICTMIFTPSSMPAFAFDNILNINFEFINTSSGDNLIRYPLQTGLIGSFLVSFATRYTYKLSRKINLSLLYILDKDILAIIFNLILCSIFGIIIAYIWPFIINEFINIITFISQDITNPINLFIYGLLEKITSLLSMVDIVREPFWYGINGGSWANFTGETFVGDVGVWNAMINHNVDPLGFGRLISPYYIINIFIYPAIILGFITLYSSNISKLKVFPIVITSIIISITTGSLIPLEIMMLLLAPLLLFFHTILSCSLFSILGYIEANLGFIHSGNTALSTPGTIVDFIIYLRDPHMIDTLFYIFIIGCIFFVLYYLLTIIYFKYLSIDILQTGESIKIVNDLIKSIGGITNIKYIECTPFRLMIELKDTNIVNRNKLFDVGTDRILEGRDMFTLFIGKKAPFIYRHLNNLLKRT